MNKVFLMGRLSKDPEVRYTQSGKAVATFTIAVNRIGKDAGADFINCVAWEKTAELIGNSLNKGNRILTEGRLQVRSYETDSGKRWVTEVIVVNMEFVESTKGGNVDHPFGGRKCWKKRSHSKKAVFTGIRLDS